MIDRKTKLLYATIASSLGWTLAVLAYLVVFLFTGNSDVLFAVGTGLISITPIWIALHWGHNRRTR